MVLRGHVPVVGIEPLLHAALPGFLVGDGSGVEDHPAGREEEGDLQAHLAALQWVCGQELIESQVTISVDEEVGGRLAEELVHEAQPWAEVEVLQAKVHWHWLRVAEVTSRTVLGSPSCALVLLVHAHALATLYEGVNLLLGDWHVFVQQPLALAAVDPRRGDEEPHAVQQRVRADCADVFRHAGAVPDVVIVPKKDPDGALLALGLALHLPALPQAALGQAQRCLQVLEL
mmetsp:Transcript_105662/g.309015  ORF Transcript_105662/g.309015 Transcript_105662/m.309015 type:complete len:231 (+) Transcript_105662:658-1350(+)